MPVAVSPPAKRTVKRKSDASLGGSSKKQKTSTDSHAAAKALVATILDSPESYEPPAGEVLQMTFVELAEYARHLEGQVAQSSSNRGKVAATKTPEQICTEAERLANTVNSGIRKQMSWKPSCKMGRAKFAFDGFCSDPNVFGRLLGLDGPPKFKAKKYSKEDIQDFVGVVVGSVRYDYLYITSDVNVRWNPETGEFKFSGSYGKESPSN